MIQGEATAKYVRTSAQKAGLVLDLIRGCDVNKATALLQFSRKHVARDISKVLRSAIANTQQKEGFGGDVGSPLLEGSSFGSPLPSCAVVGRRYWPRFTSRLERLGRGTHPRRP